MREGARIGQSTAIPGAGCVGLLVAVLDQQGCAAARFILGLVYRMSAPGALRFGSAGAVPSGQVGGAGAGLKDLAQVGSLAARDPALP